MTETIIRFVIISFIVAVVIGLLGTVTFGWTITTNPYLSVLGSFIALGLYIIPVSKLAPIIAIVVSSFLFRFIVSVIKTIWQLFPISG